MNTTKSKKISFNEDIGEIILNEAVYSIRDVWKSVIKKSLRPDIKRYETGRLLTIPTVNRAALMQKLLKQELSLPYDTFYQYQRGSHPSWSER